MNALAFETAAQPKPWEVEFDLTRKRIIDAYDRHGKGLIISTSFQSADLLHLVTQIVPGIPVIFVDTGYLFPETYRFAEEVTKLLKLNLHVYNPLRTSARQEALEGKRWEQDQAARESYNRETKVEPMNRAIKELGATGWITGMRRDQSERRAGLNYEEQQGKILKYNPILDWKTREIFYYTQQHNLPEHPLKLQGFDKIGDTHSTIKGVRGDECGLHDATTAPRLDPDYVI